MGIMDILDELEAQRPQPDPETPDPSVPDALPETGPRRRLRPEIIMAAVAGAAALLLAAALVLAMPYLPDQSAEDPQQLPQYHQDNFEPLQITEAPAGDPEAPTETFETVPVTIPPDTNPYGPYDFQYDRHNYLHLQNVESYPGVDVSAYQGNIDWKRVKNSGIDFAMIRLGYRGYESGKLVRDEKAIANLDGARDAGLRVGAYFFSEALCIEEVDEEIGFMLELLGERYLDMPIVLDWEIPAATARTRNMDGQTLTEMQLHFCRVMEERGYQPMVYFNWHQSEYYYTLSELEDYPFWLALYQDRMTYPWKVEMWQYSCTGSVPGIPGDVDLNVYMPQ